MGPGLGIWVWVRIWICGSESGFGYVGLGSPSVAVSDLCAGNSDTVAGTVWKVRTVQTALRRFKTWVVKSVPVADTIRNVRRVRTE
jgi:hypothetical protein